MGEFVEQAFIASAAQAPKPQRIDGDSRSNVQACEGDREERGATSAAQRQRLP
jgi:hypothetical protein